MCQIRRRSTPDSPEYPKYALLSDWYRYIRRRGGEMPPSEALNRADEWSFSLCGVAIFSLGGLRDVRSSLRDEPAVPFRAIDYRPSSTLGDCLAALSEFHRLQRALLYCAPSGRSFAYMWGAGLRAHLKLSNQRGKISTQRARRRVVTHAACSSAL